MNSHIPLTPTENKVAMLYSEGASFGEIADRLGRSPHTVRTHLKNIYRKLGVSTKIALLQALKSATCAASRTSAIDLSEAWEDFMLYRSALEQTGKFTWDAQIEAVGVFKELIERHPGFASAYAGLSFTTGYMAFATTCPNGARGLLKDAACHAEAALGINAFDTNAHLAMGRAHVFDGNMAMGEQHIRFSLDCDPDFEWAQYMLTFVLTHKGENTEAIRHGEDFFENMRNSDVIEPMSLTLACAHFNSGDDDAAALWAHSLLQRNRAYDHLLLTASIILAEVGQMSKVSAFAKSNPIDVCSMTPLQYRLHARNGRIVDAMVKHLSPLKDTFSEHAGQRLH